MGVIQGPTTSWAATVAPPQPPTFALMDIDPQAPATSTLHAVAFDFRHVVQKNKGKYFTFATYNDDVSYEYLASADIPNLKWSTRWKQYRWGSANRAAFKHFTIEKLPSSGKIYVIDDVTSAVSAITKAGQVVTDPDELYYVPNVNFTGVDAVEYTGSDRTGKSAIGTIRFEVFDAASYPMPYGIPKPAFGFADEPPADSTIWPTGPVAGSYYVSADDPNCSDASNGWPAKPRCTLPPNPVSVAPGGVLKVLPAAQCYQIRNGFHNITLNGQPGGLSWFVGDDRGPRKPVLCPSLSDTGSQPAVRFDGSYSRISGLVFNDVTPIWYYNAGSGALGWDKNVVYRFLDLKNFRIPSNSTGVSSGGISQDFLFYGGHVHDNTGFDDKAIPEHDFHGFNAGNVTGQWILDSLCTEVTGDCYQSSHSGNVDPSRVYLGRWVAHDFGENCINTKPFQDSVISESDCWSTRSADWTGGSGTNGQIIVAGDENSDHQKGFLYFINNRVWDTDGSGLTDQTVPGDARVYWIGNRVGHIRQSPHITNPFDSLTGFGLMSSSGQTNRYFFLNTVHDAVYGFYEYNSSGASMVSARQFVGNAFSNVRYGFRKRSEVTAASIVMNWNYYDQPSQKFVLGPNPPHPQYSYPTEYRGVGSLPYGFESNGKDSVNMQFTSVDNLLLKTTSTSALIDSLPADITERHPEMLRVLSDLPWTGGVLRDFDGNARNAGAKLDAGASEHP